MKKDREKNYIKELKPSEAYVIERLKNGGVP